MILLYLYAVELIICYKCVIYCHKPIIPIIEQNSKISSYNESITIL